MSLSNTRLLIERCVGGSRYFFDPILEECVLYFEGSNGLRYTAIKQELEDIGYNPWWGNFDEKGRFLNYKIKPQSEDEIIFEMHIYPEDIQDIARSMGYPLSTEEANEVVRWLIEDYGEDSEVIAGYIKDIVRKRNE